MIEKRKIYFVYVKEEEEGGMILQRGWVSGEEKEIIGNQQQHRLEQDEGHDPSRYNPSFEQQK